MNSEPRTRLRLRAPKQWPQIQMYSPPGDEFTVWCLKRFVQNHSETSELETTSSWILEFSGNPNWNTLQIEAYFSNPINQSQVQHHHPDCQGQSRHRWAQTTSSLGSSCLSWMSSIYRYQPLWYRNRKLSLCHWALWCFRSRMVRARKFTSKGEKCNLQTQIDQQQWNLQRRTAMCGHKLTSSSERFGDKNCLTDTRKKSAAKEKF